MSSTESDQEPETSQRRQPAQRRVARVPVNQNWPTPAPPPRYEWMRGRMQGFPGKINQYTRDNILVRIPEVLVKVGGQQLLDQFQQGPFRYLMELKRKDTAINALHELLARELKDKSFSEFERWFLVGGQEIRFGPQEWALVTGLRFGPSPFNPNDRRHVIPLSSLYHTKYGAPKKKIKANQLRDDFCDTHPDRRLGTNEQYVKAANLLVYYFILLSRDNPPIDDWAWALVENDQEWMRFPWGSWSFQILCHQLDVVKKDPSEIDNDKGSYHLYGPIWGLNLWSYEAIPLLGRSCGYRFNDHLTPRLRRWETYSAGVNMVGFFDDPRLEPSAALIPEEAEAREPYFRSLEHPDPLVVRYKPSQRHAFKKLEPEQRKSKAAREMTKAVERLKCRDAANVVIPRRPLPRATRASSEGRVHIPARRTEYVERDTIPGAPSKRPRPEPAHLEPSEVVCCIHGDPCRRRCQSDDPAMDRFIERFGDRLVHDTDDNSIVARFARAVVRRAKALMGSRDRASGSRRSRDAPSSHSYVSERREVRRSPEPQFIDDATRRSRSRTPTPAPGFQTPAHRDEAQSSHGSFASSFAREIDLDIRSPGTDDDSDVSDVRNLGDEPGPPISTLAGRQIKPSTVLQSPFVQNSETPLPSRSTRSIRESYKTFYRSGTPYILTRQSTPYTMTRELFKLIESTDQYITAEVMDLYLMYWRCRLLRRYSLAPSVGYVSYTLPGVGFYKQLLTCLQKEHPNDPELGLTAGKKYARWKADESLKEVFDGKNTYKPWSSTKFFIIVCHLSTDHWVVLRVCIAQWRVEVYDSLIHRLENEQHANHRICQLLPVTRLLPRLLGQVEFWKQHVSLQKRTDEMELVIMPPNDQFIQVDGVSCGVYACMYIDRLLSSRLHRIEGRTAERVIRLARHRIARRIFSLSVYDVGE